MGGGGVFVSRYLAFLILHPRVFRRQARVWENLLVPIFFFPTKIIELYKHFVNIDFDTSLGVCMEIQIKPWLILRGGILK